MAVLEPNASENAEITTTRRYQGPTPSSPPQVAKSTKPRGAHVTSPQQPPSPLPPASLQVTGQTHPPVAPEGYQLAYAYVPNGTKLPKAMSAETQNPLRALQPSGSAAIPPPVPPKPSAAEGVGRMMASMAKLMTTSALQAEKLLSDYVPPPESGVYNLYNEAGDRYLDLESSNHRAGTPIISWPYMSQHNAAQTWRFVRQSREGYLATIQHNNSGGNFHVDIENFRPGGPRSLVLVYQPVVWQLIPVSTNRFKLSILADFSDDVFVLTYVEGEATHRNLQMLPEDSNNASQIWTFTTKLLHYM